MVYVSRLSRFLSCRSFGCQGVSLNLMRMASAAAACGYESLDALAAQARAAIDALQGSVADFDPLFWLEPAQAGMRPLLAPGVRDANQRLAD